MFSSQVFPAEESFYLALHYIPLKKITYLLLQMGEMTALKRKNCVNKG